MRRFAHGALVAVALAFPAGAQETGEGRSLMEEGMRLFLDGLREEMSPALRELQGMAEEFGPSMRSFLQEMGPAFAEMLDEVRDWTQYHPPELLPNGDIIIRRRQTEESEQPPATPEGPTDI